MALVPMVVEQTGRGERKENDNGLGKSYSDSVLKTAYNKFNLREDSYNSSIIKQPFILSGIQRKKGEPQTLGFGSFSFIRGGAITSTARAAIDVARFTQFLLTPRGITWTAKQVGMQRSQKYGKKFTPVNLLASLAGQHLGLKFDRPDLVPLGKEDWKYNTNSSINVSPLRDIYSVFALSRKGLNNDIFPIRKPDLKGGFDSVYGIGVTRTNRYTNTFKNPGKDFAKDRAYLTTYDKFFIGPIDPFGPNLETRYYETQLVKTLNDNTLLGTTIGNQVNPKSTFNVDKEFKPRGLYKSDDSTQDGFGTSIIDYEAVSYGTIQKLANGENPSNYKGDFRNLKTLKYNRLSDVKSGTNYEDYNLEKTYGTPATFKTNSERIQAGNSSRRIDNVYDSVFNAKLQNDLVHLFFAYDTTSGTQDNNKIIQFRSTINGVTETFSPSWNGIKYPGRADKAYMYSEFERTLSFSFKAYATSRDEMKNIWKKLSELSKLTMPTYGSAYSGHICYFRLGQIWGNGIKGVPSLITSLTYTIPDDLPWDINHDGNLSELPMGVDVNIGLTILPDTIYKSSKNHYSFYDTKGFK